MPSRAMGPTVSHLKQHTRRQAAHRAAMPSRAMAPLMGSSLQQQVSVVFDFPKRIRWKDGWISCECLVCALPGGYGSSSAASQGYSQPSQGYGSNGYEGSSGGAAAASSQAGYGGQGYGAQSYAGYGQQPGSAAPPR